MKKYCLGNHPEITIGFPTEAKFIGAGEKFDLPNLEDTIKKVVREKNKIIIKGAGHTRCAITAPDNMLDAIQPLLERNIGMPLNKIDALEFMET